MKQFWIIYRSAELFLSRIFYIMLYYFYIIWYIRMIIISSNYPSFYPSIPVIVTHSSIFIFNQTKNTPFSNSSIINILTRRREKKKKRRRRRDVRFSSRKYLFISFGRSTSPSLSTFLCLANVDKRHKRRRSVGRGLSKRRARE